MAHRGVLAVVWLALTVAPGATAAEPIPGFTPVTPAADTMVARNGEMTFTVQAEQRLYAPSLIVSARPDVDPDSGRLAKASWLMPPSWWPSGVHMGETSTSPPTYSATAYAESFQFTPGTYYWQVTGSRSDPTTSPAEPVVGPIETFTISGPALAPNLPPSTPTQGWGGPTSMGFPGQRLPIAFRFAGDSRTVSDVAYGGQMFCSGIPEQTLAVRGAVDGSVPLSADGTFDLLTRRVYEPPPNSGGMVTSLDVVGRVGASQAAGTLYEQRGLNCRTPRASWSATPAFAGATSQRLPVVALSSRRDRIDRFMLVWRSNCVLSQVTNPKGWETLWLDLHGVRVDRRTGRFTVRRVFALRNVEGDRFRVRGELQGRLRAALTGTLRAHAVNVGPLSQGFSETQTERCDSGRVSFAVTR